MFRSLHMKLTLILLLLITSLMAVVGAFLTVSVSSFYINAFYQQMSDVFGGENNSFVFDLRGAAADPEDPPGSRAPTFSLPGTPCSGGTRHRWGTRATSPRTSWT